MLRTALRPLIGALLALLAIVALITAALSHLGQHARRHMQGAGHE